MPGTSSPTPCGASSSAARRSTRWPRRGSRRGGRWGGGSRPPLSPPGGPPPPPLRAVGAPLARRREARAVRLPAGDRLTGLANGSMLRGDIGLALAAGEHVAVVPARGGGPGAVAPP